MANSFFIWFSPLWIKKYAFSKCDYKDFDNQNNIQGSEFYILDAIIMFSNIIKTFL